MKTNIRLLEVIFAIFGLSMISVGIVGAQSITGSLTVDATSTTLQCPSYITMLGYTICTTSVTGNNPTGIVSFTTSSASGIFNPPQCTLNSTGSCQVSYIDTIAGSPIITASYGGDISNAGSSGNTTVTIIPTVCSISVNPKNLNFSGGAINQLDISNTGNVATEVWIYGSPWIGASASQGEFSATQTVWGTSDIISEMIPIGIINYAMTAIPLLLMNATQQIYLYAAAPPWTEAGVYQQLIVLYTNC